MSGAALRIETGRMARFLGLMRDRLALLGDGEIDAVERFCDAAGLVRLVQGPPEGGALVLLAVPSLRMLHFLDRIGCAPGRRWRWPLPGSRCRPRRARSMTCWRGRSEDGAARWA
ncbi:hypothetical protein [Rhodobacter capsulatus]|uniref:hypothetical protein n=1 Tax=Rhodobacter capsulatus TaxID=1061 RepID=UPI004027D2B8